MSQELHFTNDPAAILGRIVENLPVSGVFIITDENTEYYCAPLLAASEPGGLDNAAHITIPAGDEAKNIDTLSYVWERLTEGGANRGSLVVNLGGGVVTDLGGFAAATFKRGVKFINVPTTLLGAVDAAVGGKTGINFKGLKNEIGAFREASHVVISPEFYGTLPKDELVSGYAEVIKHALLNSRGALQKVLSFDLLNARPAEMLEILRESVEVKQRIVAADPQEQGLRKALNLGHTAAHAFEALAMECGNHLAHGVAVAHGLVVDLVLSHLQFGFPTDLLHKTTAFIKEYYPRPRLECKDYPRLIEFMRHDKKNRSADAINFTLLSEPGDVRLDCVASEEQIKTALDIMRDYLE